MDAGQPEASTVSAPDVEKPEGIEVFDSEVESEVERPGAIEVTDSEDLDETGSDDDYRDPRTFIRRIYSNLP